MLTCPILIQMSSVAPPREGQIPPDHPTHRYDYNDVDKDDNIKNDLDGDVFNPKGKTNGFSIVFIGLGWSTFKDDQLEEKNYNNDFQSEAKNHWFLLMVLRWR